jgi:nitric oxide reductase subunit B
MEWDTSGEDRTMTLDAERIDPPVSDPVSAVLKWVLLAVAILTFGLLAWATTATYRLAPPQPDRFVAADGTVLMTGDDILAGKGGFQKADLMDYGSLYGMGSYYGEDYTASALVQLGTAARDNIARATDGKSFADLAPDQQAAATATMQRDLQGIDLTKPEVVLPQPVAAAIVSVRDDLADGLAVANPATGWTPAYSLDPQLARQTADFLVFSALTTVARRPGATWPWTENWPYEPLVGNTPTTNTFVWTWISFCFTFFAFGVVLFIYEYFLNNPDDAPMDPVLSAFRPLTPSQKRVWKYFLVVAALLLVQIAAGTIMAHSYYDRTSFYGIAINDWFPFNFLRDVHIQAPIVWIGLSWIGAALFLAPAIAGGQEAKGQQWLVDLLFWVTLLVVAGALIGDYLGIMGVIDKDWFWFGNQGLSYIQLGRFWQIGFFIGLAFWSFLVMRALWPSAAQWWGAAGQFWTGRIRLEHLIWASTVNIAVLYVFGMIPLTGIEKSFTLTDFWRWWVVHLWVEQSFEFFAAAMSAYLLMATGLVSRKLAERATYFEIILIFLGGVIGTGHHLYWAGGPSIVGADGQHVFLHRGAAAGAADHRSDQSLQADPGTSGVQLPARLHLRDRRGVLELRRRGCVRRRHAERAVGELLRARHLPDAESRAHCVVWRVRRTGDRADLFLPALYPCRATGLRREARALGFLALQWRLGAVDPAQFLPDRLAATGCGL